MINRHSSFLPPPSLSHSLLSPSTFLVTLSTVSLPLPSVSSPPFSSLLFFLFPPQLSSSLSLPLSILTSPIPSFCFFPSSPASPFRLPVFFPLLPAPFPLPASSPPQLPPFLSLLFSLSSISALTITTECYRRPVHHVLNSGHWSDGHAEKQTGR